MQRERVRQKKLKRQRRKREQKRQALQRRPTLVISAREVVVPFAKLSDTLIEFAPPLIDRLPSDPSVDQLKLVLTFASFVWIWRTISGANIDTSAP